MSANKEAVRLCEHIVRQAFGDVVARVASTLLNRGRLPISTLKHLSATPLATTQAAVLTLIQHNLVRYCGVTGEDEVPVGGDQFEFETFECLMRLRWGRILAATERDFAKEQDREATKIIQLVLMSGKLTAPHIIEHFTNQLVDPTEIAKKTDELNKLLVKLITTRHLIPTTPMLHTIYEDHLDRHFKGMKSRSHGLLSKKDDQQMRDQATAEVIGARSAEMEAEKALKPQAMKAQKKDAKRRAIEQERAIKPDACLRVNYSVYDIKFRNELLVEAAEKRLNKPASVVLKAAIDATIDQQMDIDESVTHEAVTTTVILNNLSTSQLKQLPYGLTSAPKGKDIALVEAYVQILSTEDALGDRTASFLVREGDTNTAAYRVQFDQVGTQLKAAVLSKLVKEKLSEKAARILQILITGKKLSEPQVQEYAMMELKDCRSILSSLSSMCLIETQDVPKTAVDVRKVYSFLITTMYKTLGNLLQREEKEMADRSALLEKMQRSDVTGRDMLQQREQNELAELDKALVKLRLAKMRTELNVMILRDLPGGPPGVRYERKP